MSELVLTRTPGDRTVYELAGAGTLRLSAWNSRRGTAEAGGRRWEITRRGLWQKVIEATDETGWIGGEFQAAKRRGGGVLRWSGRELELRRDGMWRQRYTLAEGGRTLAGLEGKSHGKRPVTVTTEGSAELDPGLLLFAAFVVRALAGDAAAAAAS